MSFFLTSSPGTIELGVNIDHVATLRNARGTRYPDPIRAALLAEEAGADAITLHLREDRRHIVDADVRRLRTMLRTRMNLECALTPEMLAIACEVKPHDVCLVPEKREELTTEGGLDIIARFDAVRAACRQLADAGIRVSLFVDPDEAQLRAAHDAGAPVVELHTGCYANSVNDGGSGDTSGDMNGDISSDMNGDISGNMSGGMSGAQDVHGTNSVHGASAANGATDTSDTYDAHDAQREAARAASGRLHEQARTRMQHGQAARPGMAWAGTTQPGTAQHGQVQHGQAHDEYERVARAVQCALTLGLKVNAGHGLHYANVQPIAAIDGIAELNIGHAIVAHAIFAGWENAVREMKAIMVAARLGARD